MRKTITVKNEFGEPLVGAHIQIIPFFGATTDRNGQATVVATGDAPVQISYVGTKTQFHKFSALPSQITMLMDSLEEVVITAPAPAPAPAKKSYLLPAALGFAGLILLMSIGGSSSSKPKQVTL
jgi:hypothetical protein